MQLFNKFDHYMSHSGWKNLDSCLDFLRCPENEVEQTILFLNSYHTCFILSAFGLPHSALDKKLPLVGHLRAWYAFSKNWNWLHRVEHTCHYPWGDESGTQTCWGRRIHRSNDIWYIWLERNCIARERIARGIPKRIRDTSRNTNQCIPQYSKFSWIFTSKAKFSGNFGGALSPKKLLHNRSASLLVIIPHLREEIGIAPALRRISS